MGRAVVRRPQLFLFDEPLSNLDAALRAQMRVELKRLHARLGATMIYVTHDQVEAMTLADRIALLRAGAIEQLGTPDDLYRRPATLFAARFFGTPEMNLIEGAISRGSEFESPVATVALPGRLPEGRALLGVRAEDIEILARNDGRSGAGTVEVVENLGGDALVHLLVGAQRLVLRADAARAPRRGDRIAFHLGRAADAGRLHLFGTDGRRLDGAGAPREPA
jgi:ABC-type sugar transport system ATPase subunit